MHVKNCFNAMSVRIGSLLMLFSLVLTGFGWAAQPRLERISFAPRSDGQGHVMRLHTTARVHAFSAPNYVAADQVEITLFNTDLAVPYVHDAPQGQVEKYIVFTVDNHIVLKLFLRDASVETQVYRDRESSDVLLNLTQGRMRRAGTVATNPATPPSTTEPNTEARERWRIDTIVIDAGHGGKDTGAIGVGGLREKDVVLAVAKKLGGYLKEHLGVNVVYTRSNDRFIPLRERGRIANEAGGKLFISIHANAARNATARGTETYFLGMHKTDAAKSVMERENSVIELENDQEHYKSYNDADLVRMQLVQSAYMRHSEALAGQIEAQFAERVGRRSRGVKQAGFYVLWSASMPALLVELGFVTNPREAAFLRSKNGQTYMASAIFRAVKTFKNDYEKALQLVRAQ